MLLPSQVIYTSDKIRLTVINIGCDDFGDVIFECVDDKNRYWIPYDDVISVGEMSEKQILEFEL